MTIAKVRQILVPLGLLLLLLIGGWYRDRQIAKSREVLTGFFESQPTRVASRAAGRVARINVREGDTVRAGQPLVDLEADPAVADALARTALAEQSRQQLREAVDGPRPDDISRQRAMVAESAAELARLRNGPTKEDIGASRARVAQAVAADLRLHAGARPEEIAEARAAELSAGAHLAAAERGDTAEERGQVKSRLDAAIAQELLATSEAGRYARLYAAEAVTKQQFDQIQANLAQMSANREVADQAWKRSEKGNPTDELAEAREDWRQKRAALDLVLAGSRAEDIAGGDATLTEARQNLESLLVGSRPEDIHAAADRLAQAQDSLNELLSGTRAEQISQARAAANSAAATARSSSLTIAERTVRSPCDGIVERIPVSVGDLVAAGTLIVRVSSPNDLWIRIFVPEASLPRVEVGSVAELHIDGIADPIAGHVESVATDGEFTPANLEAPDERGKQVFEVRLRLNHPDPRVKAGMYASVTRIGSWTP